MIATPGWAVRAMAALRRAADLLQQLAKSLSSSSTVPHIVLPHASLAFAVVALTAVAGLVVAAALGGTLFFSLSRRKQKGRPLTPKQWWAAFDSVSGRLTNHQKVLDKIRFGGIDPSIRAAVWPFLLGFYEIDSTSEERESEKRRKRELYIALKLRCNTLRDRIHEVSVGYEHSDESTKVSSDGLSSSSSSSSEQKSAATFDGENSNGSREVISDGQSSFSEEQKNAATLEGESLNGSREVSFDGSSSPSDKQKSAGSFEWESKKEGREPHIDGLNTSSDEQRDAAMFECESENGIIEVLSDGRDSPSEEHKDAAQVLDHHSFSNSGLEDREGDSEELLQVKGGASVDKDSKVATSSDNPSSTGKTNEENVKDEELPQTKNESARADPKVDSLEATDEFINCQRIIRVDAVRMNAEWVPYSPSQANVTKELAFELARNVDLRDDEHLEPCRQHHAARLVAILEAYALYDPETGYCQGMSDLLSPFVALLDEDYEAFWCFVDFMSTARYNFRSDETGIRRQLNKTAHIFKAADPRLYSHLESIDADNCFFVYRMVVVLLRRELTFEQTISLWEVLWAEKRALSVSHARRVTKKTFLTEDLILYVIVAAVRQKRKLIMGECRALDELLRECNSMAGHLDVWKLLYDARAMSYAVRRQLADK